MGTQDGIVNPAVGGWSEALEKLHQRVANRFARSGVRELVCSYLIGLLGGGGAQERLAAGGGYRRDRSPGSPTPPKLGDVGWTVRADLRDYVVEHLSGFWRGVFDRLPPAPALL